MSEFLDDVDSCKQLIYQPGAQAALSDHPIPGDLPSLATQCRYCGPRISRKTVDGTRNSCVRPGLN